MRCEIVRRWGRLLLSVAVVAALGSTPAAAQDPDRPDGATAGTDEALHRAATAETDVPAADAGTSWVDEPDTGPQPTPAVGPRPTPAGGPRPVEQEPEQAFPAEESPATQDDEPLKPIPDPIAAGPVEIEAASFKDVVPGVTPIREVEKAWGPPKEIRKLGNALMHLYAVEPFEWVEVSFYKDKVTAIVIRLKQAFSANTVAQQLELTNVRPVIVSDELGEILGQAYPERGVLFSFEPSETPGKVSMKVAQIILEPITAEPFVLRAETNLDSDLDFSRRDLQQALKIQPANARAHWLLSRILVASGQYDQAVAESDQAVRLEPGNARYRVTQSQILGQVGRLNEAVQHAQKAVETSHRRPHIKARALCLLGDLTASGSRPDYKRAIQYHMEAVSVADPLAADRHPAIRLVAKEVLINAHLGAAHDIAWGSWKGKEEAVSTWLGRADAYAEELIQNDGGSPEHRLRVSTRALAACVGVCGQLDPAHWTQKAIRTGGQLIATTEDPVRKARYQWDLGMALYDALQIYQMRDDHETALKYGELAIEYLEEGNRRRQSPTSNYLLGRLYFRLGAIHAIRDQNHRVAITWFDKAVPLLQKPMPKEAFADLGRHGETFVGMGVSYWESGRREEAVRLTQIGVELMEQAVKRGSLKEAALAVPYENLSSMHRQLGAPDEADRFEQMASKVRDTRVQ